MLLFLNSILKESLMGLADEKMKLGVQQQVTIYEKNLAADNLPIKFEIDWPSFANVMAQPNADRAQYACQEFNSKMRNWILNYENPEYKLLVDAIRSSFGTIRIIHSSTGQEYAYSLEIKDKACCFTADMTKFTWSSSSRADQPSLRSYLEKIL